MINFYYKIYHQGKDERNPHKHTITNDQVGKLVDMMCSTDVNDVNIAREILSKSNCDQNYSDVIWGIQKNYYKPRWMFYESRDGTNKWMSRIM